MKKKIPLVAIIWLAATWASANIVAAPIGVQGGLKTDDTYLIITGPPVYDYFQETTTTTSTTTTVSSTTSTTVKKLVLPPSIYDSRRAKIRNMSYSKSSQEAAEYCDPIFWGFIGWFGRLIE